MISKEASLRTVHHSIYDMAELLGIVAGGIKIAQLVGNI